MAPKEKNPKSTDDKKADAGGISAQTPVASGAADRAAAAGQGSGATSAKIEGLEAEIKELKTEIKDLKAEIKATADSSEKKVKEARRDVMEKRLLGLEEDLRALSKTPAAAAGAAGGADVKSAAGAGALAIVVSHEFRIKTATQKHPTDSDAVVAHSYRELRAAAAKVLAVDSKEDVRVRLSVPEVAAIGGERLVDWVDLPPCSDPDTDARWFRRAAAAPFVLLAVRNRDTPPREALIQRVQTAIARLSVVEGKKFSLDGVVSSGTDSPDTKARREEDAAAMAFWRDADTKDEANAVCMMCGASHPRNPGKGKRTLQHCHLVPISRTELHGLPPPQCVSGVGTGRLHSYHLNQTFNVITLCTNCHTYQGDGRVWIEPHVDGPEKWTLAAAADADAEARKFHGKPCHVTSNKRRFHLLPPYELLEWAKEWAAKAFRPDTSVCRFGCRV